MRKQPDEVLLSNHTTVQRWPVELAEELLASPLPWGPPAYGLGGYLDDPTQPDQSADFHTLAYCVDGAYERHRTNGCDAWQWANSCLDRLRINEMCAQYSTQDLLDLVFLSARLQRFCDGYIRSVEPLLRQIVQEVVQRIRSEQPPLFLFNFP